MKDFEAAKEFFKDTVDPSLYFDSISAEIARNKLQEAIGNPAIPLMFIIGDPGVGKSHIMRVMHHATALKTPTVLIEHPFLTLAICLKNSMPQGEFLLMNEKAMGNF